MAFLFRKTVRHEGIVQAAEQKADGQAGNHAAEDNVVAPSEALQRRDDDDVVHDVVGDHVGQPAHVPAGEKWDGRLLAFDLHWGFLLIFPYLPF